MSTGRGTDKILEKLRTSVNNGNYYEAHQMYRTVCRRYIKQEKHNSAIELLYSGGQLLLEHKQIGSGTDLSLYLVDAYKEAEIPVTEESRARITRLLSLLPNEPGRRRFMDAAVQWSVKFSDSVVGDPELHHFIGEMLWKEKSYSEAEPHFLAGLPASSRSYGNMLAEWASQDHPSKLGTYISRAVLQYLCLRNIRDARTSFDTFIEAVAEKDSSIKSGTAPYRPTLASDPVQISLYTIPLLNFLQLLILTVQRDARDLFTKLRTKYSSSLAVEPSFDDLLNKIGEVFFDIKLQKPQQYNLLQDLMNSFLSPSGSASESPAGARMSMSSDLE
ncbi:5815_t:CDS:2 [Paraglomus brasilianum]|uniref:5815_t:CDS:1 n=1 Tax=Paraglomus brasilianum TaxID=144538 RepID=A0A9N9GLQ0_9GLOM|nr:5815_t:CDS:2 [Paraglomus brasilianum]